MITFDSATHPLEFACIAAKQLTFFDSQIHSLRQVAARYAGSGAAVGKQRALEILEEARQLHQQHVNERGNHAALGYPTFAVDCESVGRHDLALGIIEESLQVAERLRRKPRISMMIMLADACHCIGEVTRCRELLEDVRSYYQDRKSRLSHEDGPFDVLHSLYLKLGEVDAAKALAAKMKGVIKVDALVATAFHLKPFWKFERGELHDVSLYCKRYGYEYPLAKIAELMAKEGFYLRGKCYISSIKTSSIVFEGTLSMAIALLENGKPADALKILQTLYCSTGTFFYYQPEKVRRLLSLLMPDHRDAVALLLNRVRDEANEVNAFRDHYLRYTRLVGLVAQYSFDEAEALIDLVLDHPVTDLGHGGKGPKFFFNPTGVCIIYELAMVVEEYGLRWDENRREQFRNYMVALSRQNVGHRKEQSVPDHRRTKSGCVVSELHPWTQSEEPKTRAISVLPLVTH